jgi:Metallo-peptidase family M12B Reprolysin-like/Secretion system C-terminal sorting domain/Bacterial pre-peptidase C-terminal domain/Fibronectin type III domain
MKKIVLLTMVLAMISIAGFSQSDQFWSADNASRSSIVTDKAVARLSFPTDFKLFSLNAASLRQEVFSIVDNRSSKHSTIISLPNANGNLEQFEIFEASNFEPALQAQFPNIRAYSGKGVTDKSATLKLSVSPQGIQTMVFRTDKPNEFIEPYAKDHSIYAVFASQRTKGQLAWRCATPDADLATGLNTQVNNLNIAARSGGDLKTMRLAQSCNGEYANFFGASTAGTAADQALVLSAFNNTLTRCNGVYEKDLALHLNLVASSTSVIFYNPATDPYSTTLSQWNAQLQSTLTANIGEANYDIGHMFGASGGGGNAGCIGCICTNGSKGSGITSPADGIPQGDNFDIDYVAHEVGHQLGGNHTFSQSLEGTGVNKEVGSGISIMGYAGITAQDVAPHSIAYFHQASIAQIQANLATKTCPITSTMANVTPVVAPVGNFTIPISTPFALTGSATDANASDVLTYSWEQNDNSTVSGTSSVASPTKATGPNWLSFSPTTSGTRLFPKLSTILDGLNVTPPITGGDAGANIEALSSVSRTLNFRLTVRDNAPYSSTAPLSIGQTQFTDAVVTVSNTSGPFAVTAPNTAVTWAGGSSQTITWSVNNTTAAPVSCANVKICLSTDGGLTFPTVLVASTPNDGTEALVIPTISSTTARIKVEAVGNIFFDISNTNFTIGGAIACGDATGLASSAIGNNAATVSWNAVANATSYAVEYKLNTTTVWTSFATAQTATTANLTGLTQGSLYDWRVQATCASGTGNFVAAQFTTTVPFVCNAPSGLASSTITSSSATVSWTAVSGAASYAVEYKLNSDVVWTSAASATTATSVSLTGLSASSLYDYRVSTNCGANGASGFTAAQFTTSAPFVCNAPTGLVASAITSSSATVSWTTVSGAANYAVEYKLNSATVWTSAAAATTATSVSITGLSASSLYDYRVSTNCGANGASGFTAAQFTTSAPFVCNAPTGLVSSAISSSSATVRWTAVSGAVNYTVEYKLNSATLWTIAAAATTVTSVSITGLSASSLYDYRVSTNCGANGASGFTAAQFTTSAVGICPGPLDVSTNGTVAGAATIPFNTDVKGLINTTTDLDYYKFVVTTGGTATITLSTLPGDYDIRLYSSNGTTQLAISQNGSTASETITRTYTAGTYYIRVYGYNGANSATTCYTLRVQLGTATRGINDDTQFSNNTISISPNPTGYTANLLYKFKEAGNASIIVTDKTGAVVLKKSATVNEGQNRQALDVSTLANGMYFIQIQNGAEVQMAKIMVMK